MRLPHPDVWRRCFDEDLQGYEALAPLPKPTDRTLMDTRLPYPNQWHLQLVRAALRFVERRSINMLSAHKQQPVPEVN